MTKDELRRRGYYLFGIDQDRFVQVRELETDRCILMGLGSEEDALRRAQKYFAELDAARRENS